MTCTEVRKLLPGLALGDLDAEPATGVTAHLHACDACRVEADTLGRTVTALRSPALVVPSTTRRSAAVAAMIRSRAEAADGFATGRRRSWAPFATAAAFLLALVTALTLRGGGTAFTVAAVTGDAKMRDAWSREWRPVLPGSAISVGDRIVTERGSVVRLSSSGVWFAMDQESSIEVAASRRVTLDRGRLLVSAPSSQSLVVADLANNSASVTGRVELRLREVVNKLGGSLEVKGLPSRVPAPMMQIVRSLVARVQTGEAALDGAQNQRIRAFAGEEGRFDGGRPETAPLAESGVGEWAEDRR